MKRPSIQFLLPIVLLAAISFVSLQAGIIQAIIPAAAPTANKRGNTNVFQLASSNAAAAAGSPFCDDGSGNATTSGCSSSGGSSSAGLTVYSGPAGIALSGTVFFPIGGGGIASTTEANSESTIRAATTISNFGVDISIALGTGNSAVFTWRKNGASQAVTCTISGSSALACGDTTHSFTAVSGDILDIQCVFSGTIIVTPLFVMNTQVGIGSGSGATVAPPYLTVGANTYGPVYAITAPPSIGSFTAVNLGGASLTNFNGAIFAQSPASSTTNMRLWELALPARPWSIIAGIVPSTYGQLNFMAEAINVRDSSSSKFISFGYVGGAIRVDTWNNPTSFNGTSFTSGSSSGLVSVTQIFLKILDDGTNFTFLTSTDGVNFIQVFQQGRTAFLATPDTFGFNMDTNDNSVVPASYLLFSWKQGTS